jgi:mannose-6-phosphate isomerase-like protein (cupin superfamily)
METFDLDTLLARHAASGASYFEFLRVPALNAGIYRLAAGSADPQQPHAQDEVYYIIQGRAVFSCDGHAKQPVQEGATIYVEAGRAHRFEDIAEDLTILVLFAG